MAGFLTDQQITKLREQEEQDILDEINYEKWKEEQAVRNMMDLPCEGY